jgi:hypothetical protein
MNSLPRPRCLSAPRVSCPAAYLLGEILPAPVFQCGELVVVGGEEGERPESLEDVLGDRSGDG